MISIPVIRRQLTNDLLGRHIYLFGRASSSVPILRRLADAGADEGTIVLSADAEARVSIAALVRLSLPVGAVPLFSTIATLALTEAIGSQGLTAAPIWPDHVIVDGETVAHGLVDPAAIGTRTSSVVLGGDVDLGALEKAAGHAIDPNGLVAAFLNAVEKWSTAYAAHGPAAIRGTVQFFPRGPVVNSATEVQGAC